MAWSWRQGLLALGLLGCGEPDPAGSVRTPGLGALRVEVDGCAMRQHGACVRLPPGPLLRCETTPGLGGPVPRLRLRLVDPPLGALIVAWDGHPASAVAELTDAGLRWTLDVPPAARTLTVHAPDQPALRWSMALVEADEPPVLTAARHARSSEEATAWTELQAVLPTLEGRHRAVALELGVERALGLAALSHDHSARVRSYERVLTLSEEVFGLLERLGDPARASCNGRRALFVALEYLHDLQAARRWRERLRALARVPLPARVGHDYYDGLFAQRMGELQSALDAYARVEQGARHADDPTYLLASLPQRALVLATLRRPTQARALLDRARDLADTMRCRDARRVLNSVAWARLRLGEQGLDAGDPLPELYDVLALASARDDPHDPCSDFELELLVRVNLALAALERGWLGEAETQREHLPPLGLGGVESRLQAWIELVELRLRLVGGDRAALAEWMMRHDVAEPVEPSNPPGAPLPPDQAWRHAYWRGRAHDALGQPREAIAAYEAAERALDRVVGRLDFDAAAEGLLLGHQASAGRLVERLVEQGRAERALCVARSARRRMDVLLDRTARISALSEPQRQRWREALVRIDGLRDQLDRQQRRRWAVPLDRAAEVQAELDAAQLRLNEASRDAFALLHDRGAPWPSDGCDVMREPEPGALHLLYFPLDSRLEAAPWMGFAFDSSGILATARLPLLPHTASAEAWSALLLRPFESEVHEAREVVLLPVGPLWSVPLAALPWEGDVLLAHAPVVWSLDLTRRPTLPSAPEPRRALVVGAPQGDLRGAEREAQGVAEALRGAGWVVRSLEREHAAADAVRGELARADLFHYAGHGHRDGVEGWASRLPLAAGGELTVRDVLSLPRVPPVALLPACDTTPAADGTLGGGMSMARALLLAGAELLVASEGELPDHLAERLVERLYAEGIPQPGTGQQALRRALLEVRERDPRDPAWAQVRVMRP